MIFWWNFPVRAVYKLKLTFWAVPILVLLTFCANRSVLNDSLANNLRGFRCMIISVFELPPSEFWSKCVSWKWNLKIVNRIEFYLGVSVRHMLAFAAQCSNNIAERRKRGVYLSRFYEALSSCARFFDTLRTGKIDKIQAGLHFLSVSRVFAGDEKDKNWKLLKFLSEI